MKKIKYIIIIVSAILFYTSCEKNDNFIASGNDEINLFIWRAMNTYYLFSKISKFLECILFLIC